ncbi:MAG: FecR family protein [bacterium]|nr:FecR family protein [bacterium]
MLSAHTSRNTIATAFRRGALAAVVCIAASMLLLCGKKTPFPGAALVNPIGTVTLEPAKGDAYRFIDAMEFQPEGLLLEGDLVRTSANSRVDLQFPAGLVMRLGANSAVKLSRGKILGGENFGQVLMDLEKGRLMTRKQKLNSKSKVVIRTPTLIASVRGTEFLVKQDGSGGEVLVQEGTVVVDGPGTPGTRDIEEPPSPEAPDSEEPPAPEAPEESSTDPNDAEEEIDDPYDTLDEDLEAIVNGQEVEEGNKIEVTDDSEAPDEEDLAELDEDDREELEEMSDGLDYMDAQGLEQIEGILQSFEEAKAEIREAVDEQREKNREMMDSEKARMRDEFQAQKDAIRGEGEVKDAQGKAQSELDRIKNMQ